MNKQKNSSKGYTTHIFQFSFSLQESIKEKPENKTRRRRRRRRRKGSLASFFCPSKCSFLPLSYSEPSSLVFAPPKPASLSLPSSHLCASLLMASGVSCSHVLQKGDLVDGLGLKKHQKPWSHHYHLGDLHENLYFFHILHRYLHHHHWNHLQEIQYTWSNQIHCCDILLKLQHFGKTP